jgi:hypothetical protein
VKATHLEIMDFTIRENHGRFIGVAVKHTTDIIILSTVKIDYRWLVTITMIDVILTPNLRAIGIDNGRFIVHVMKMAQFIIVFDSGSLTVFDFFRGNHGIL